MELKDVDLNLLVVFNQMLVERSVSKVADKQGLSQPAVSNILNRLRKLLGDDLFLRTARGMEPTPFALQMAESIGYALNTIYVALNERAVFDPLTSTRHFTLGLGDLGEVNLLPRLMERLDALAPHVSIGTYSSHSDDIFDAMSSGQVDVTVGTLSQPSSGLFQRRLFRQRYVCMFRKGHALDKGAISQDDYSAAEHVAVAPPGSSHAQLNEFLERRGVKRNVRMTVPHHSSVGYILGLGRNALVATVPASYAEICAEPFGLTYVECPFAVPEVGVHLFWHARYHREAGNSWLRQVIVALFANTAAGEEQAPE